jgi:hypothetical protein
MKNYLLSLGTLALLAFTSCGGDEATTPAVDELAITTPVQNVMIAEVTATWCGPCGAWGKPTILSVSETYGKKAVKVSFNASASNDVLYVSDAAAYADYLNISGYPTQAINLKTVDTDGLTLISQIKDKMIRQADSVVALAPPDFIIILTGFSGVSIPKVLLAISSPILVQISSDKTLFSSAVISPLAKFSSTWAISLSPSAGLTFFGLAIIFILF